MASGACALEQKVCSDVSASSLHSTDRVLPVPVREPVSSDASDKLYLVTRADLSAGYQAVQTAHAVADWTVQHPQAAAVWRARSNSLIVLTACDEQGLYGLVTKARARGIGYTVFREPDLCDEITAVAFTPGDTTRRMLSNQPLVGRGAHDPGHHLLMRRAVARERRLRELAARMEGCEQTPGQDVLAHGRSVREHYAVLRAHLEGTLDLGAASNWRLPGWVGAYRSQLAAAAGDEWLVDRYLTLHDAGKPDVVMVDDQGRRRFPGHGQRSPRAYLEAYLPADPADDSADDPADGLGDVHRRVAELIAHDMDIHLLKAAGVDQFCENPNAVVHLLAGLAEVTSNAAMFGGVDSTSFKIKYKQLVSRGNAICGWMFGEPGAERAL